MFLETTSEDYEGSTLENSLSNQTNVAIIGVAVGGFLLMLIIAILAVVFYKQHSNRSVADSQSFI